MSFIKNRIDSEYRKYKDLDWSLIAEKKIIATILDFCYKNNTIPIKELFKDLPNSKLALCTTDGGWINVLKFKKFLEGNNDIIEKELTEEEKNKRFEETALKISQAVERKKNKEQGRDEYAEEVVRVEQLVLEGEMEEYEEIRRRELADRYCGGDD